MKVRVKQAFNDWQLSHNFKSEFSVNIADVVEIIDETQAQGDETTPCD